MFPEFGAPIVEGFSSNVEYEDANDRCLYDKTTERIKCLPCDYDSETSDDEEYDAKKEEEIDNEIVASRNNSSTPPTTQAAPTQSLEDGEEEEAEEEEVEEDEKKKNNKTDESSDEESSGEESSGEESSGEESSVDKKKDEESPSVTEPFFGGNIEHFSNKDVAQKATSMNTILKAVMITCLFYVLAHKDAKKYLMGKVFKNVKGENYLYIAMVIFFIVFYIISVFL